jgi:hypothetical protein
MSNISKESGQMTSGQKMESPNWEQSKVQHTIGQVARPPKS